MNRISRCTSRMCSRPARAESTVVGGLTVGVLVAAAAADALIPAGAERPAAVLGRRPVTGQQHHPDIGGHPGVVQCAVQLVDGVRPKRVAHLGPVERHPHGRQRLPAVDDVAVVGDVGQVGELVGRFRRRAATHSGRTGCRSRHHTVAGIEAEHRTASGQRLEFLGRAVGDQPGLLHEAHAGGHQRRELAQQRAGLVQPTSRTSAPVRIAGPGSGSPPDSPAHCAPSPHRGIRRRRSARRRRSSA